MIITHEAVNATYDERNNAVMTMIYAVIINHIGDNIEDYDVLRHIKINCYNQTKGTYMDPSSLLKIVKKHIRKYS